MITFMHYRNTDAYGNILPHGGLTVAINDENRSTVQFVMARCHSDDLYIKARGRNIAAARLQMALNGERNIRYHSIPVERGQAAKSAVNRYLKEIGELDSFA